MKNLKEYYASVYGQIQSLCQEISLCEAKAAEINKSSFEETAQRIAHLESVLEKIDEYLLKVRAFQELAKKNLSSLNILTIDAPPGYRVNLNRLRNWAMMIDPSSSDDPYAQRVYVVAKCDECFLLQKQEEFSDTIARLRSNNTVGLKQEADKFLAAADTYRKQLKGYAMSEDVTELAKAVVKANDRFCHGADPAVFSNPAVSPEWIAPGAYSAPLPFEKPQREWLKNQFGHCLDADTGSILFPIELPMNKDFVITVTCSPSRRNILDSGIRNFIFNLIDQSPAGSQKVYLLDALRYNATALGGLKLLENTFAMAAVPRNPEQLTGILEKLLSDFSDVDDIIGTCDSVRDYNRNVEKENRLPLSTLVIYGWPNSYDGEERDLLLRIMTNYERYGVSFVIVTYSNQELKQIYDRPSLPEYAFYNAIHISMVTKNATITFPESKPETFQWYLFDGNITNSYAESLKAVHVEKESLGNEYTKRYSLSERPVYTREYRKVELPFGIDGKEQAHSLSFENENFAAYLVGASRSGKSTLIHTLIAGLIRNYHPDNLELWLADFKQLEFKRYMKHCPPHVRYVLLDESTELIYDLIDRLTAEMMERQKLFSRLGKQRIDQIDTTKLEKPLPIIFVILDEFSIMSQSIAESQTYKLRLQNILAKGAALGIRFLFSSQTFTTGVSGLTSTARAQIQQRISMKGTKDEISETLDLSPNLKTEQVRNWMDALPPHYALVKFRPGPDAVPEVKRFLVMYFEDYAPRDKMIDDINASMHAVEEYDPTDIMSYTDKHPILVDGNSFDVFNRKELLDTIAQMKYNPHNSFTGEEVFLAYGTPRLMVKNRFSALSSETRENILLVSGASEQTCCASILLSSALLFAAQGGNVEVWSYEKNRVRRECGELFSAKGFHLYDGMEAVCERIRYYREIVRNRSTVSALILLLGMDRICMDFDYINSDAGEKPDSDIASLRKEFEKNGAVVKTDADRQEQERASAWVKQKMSLKRQLRAVGRSKAEIDDLLEQEKIRFFESFDSAEKQPFQMTESAVEVPDFSEKYGAEDEKKEISAYNAMEDFQLIVKLGSKQGIHFMLALTSFADFKSTGLKLDYFRYRMAFQLPAEESRDLFSTKCAESLPEHICQYYDLIDRYSFRPYLHEGIGWDGWTVDADGNAVSPFIETDE